ncbi:MAG: ABC transporter ATP-binding protein [Proteobacteria bacterium]|jgi:ABC-2 type transport system ATP-binding protein|nr:ABC transporter ATP-binding protein [Pseudomonadota bacterium]MDA1300085.1 ABC transporter ATP-binding protein [Pseudomonadota bacterium]
MPIIEADGIAKSYPLANDPSQSFLAVDHVSLVIEEGEVYGILGPNGAGKTTTLEMLEGLTEIDEGLARVDGIDVSKHPTEVKKRIGVQLQSSEYFDRLSLVELLKLFAHLYGVHDFDPLALLREVNLEEKARARPASLSGGQRQRFTIACALVNQPRVLFLDEPTTGLDPQARHNLWHLVERLNAQGITIVLTTHYMEEAETLCGRIAIMDHGIIIAEDTPDNLIMAHAPRPREVPAHGNIEDVFLALTGHGLRD